MKKIIIFGTGTLAQQAFVFLSQDSPYKIEAFTLNEKYIVEENVLGLSIIPFEKILELYPPNSYSILVAIGYKKVNKNRAEVYNACKNKGYDMINYIGSKISSWGHIEIGDNVFVYGNGDIQPFAKIGNNFISACPHIGHNVCIGDHVFMGGHVMIAGNAKIGDYCFLGANSTIGDGITIAPECIIGAGAIITKDTEKCGVYPGPKVQAAPYKSYEARSFN